MTDARPHIAPEGKIWVCMGCFERHKDRSYFESMCLKEVMLCDEVQPAPGFYAVAQTPG